MSTATGNLPPSPHSWNNGSNKKYGNFNGSLDSAEEIQNGGKERDLTVQDIFGQEPDHYHCELPGAPPPFGDGYVAVPRKEGGSRQSPFRSQYQKDISLENERKHRSDSIRDDYSIDSMVSDVAVKSDFASPKFSSKEDESMASITSPSSQAESFALHRYPSVFDKDDNDNLLAVHLAEASRLNGIGLLDAAAQHLSSALRLEPLSPRIANDYGAVLQQLWRLDEAAKILQKAILLWERDKEDRNEASYVECTTYGQFIVPNEYENKEVERQKDRPPIGYAMAMNNLGVTYRELGKFSDAERQWRKALAVDQASYEHWKSKQRCSTRHFLSTSEESNSLEICLSPRCQFSPLLLRPSRFEGKQAAQLSGALYNLANLLRETGRVSEAAEILRSSLGVPHISDGGAAVVLLAISNIPVPFSGYRTQFGLKFQRGCCSNKMNREEQKGAYKNPGTRSFEHGDWRCSHYCTCGEKVLYCGVASIEQTLISRNLLLSYSRNEYNNPKNICKKCSFLYSEIRRLQSSFRFEVNSLAILWSEQLQLPDATPLYSALSEEIKLFAEISFSAHDICGKNAFKIESRKNLGCSASEYLVEDSRQPLMTKQKINYDDFTLFEKRSSNNYGIHILTQWFLARSFDSIGVGSGKYWQMQTRRQNEINACLLRNLENPEVAAVHLLLESACDAHALRRSNVFSMRPYDTNDTNFTGDCSLQSSHFLNSRRNATAEGRMTTKMRPQFRKISWIERKYTFSRKFSRKMAVSILGHRATFFDFFAYANRYLVGEICLVINADLFLGRWPFSVAQPLHLRGRDIRQIFIKPDALEDRVLSLLRWDWVWPDKKAENDGSSTNMLKACTDFCVPSAVSYGLPFSRISGSLFSHFGISAFSSIYIAGSTGSFTPRIDSQDAWLFKSPLPSSLVSKNSNFLLGRPRCDNRLAMLFEEAGFRVENPGLLFSTYHVESPFPKLDENNSKNDGHSRTCTAHFRCKSGNKQDSKPASNLGSYAGASSQVHGAVQYVPIMIL